MKPQRTRVRRRGRAGPVGALCAVCALLALASGGARAQVEEELFYRWHLGGYKGLLARLIMPGSGDAVLRTSAHGSGGQINELAITSPASRRGEFWRYGSQVESSDCRQLVSAWTEQYFRGRAKEKRSEIEEDGVLDIPSCICRIRRNPPEQAIATRIWSDGRVYPIVIADPVEGEVRMGDRRVATRTYSVAGLRRPGGRVWKGRLVLVLAMDERRTPLEIALVQPGLSVRLVLEESS